MRIYLVGGAVRDLLLGRPVSDRDYLVLGASEAEFEAAHPGAQKVGKSFPVYLYQGSEYAWPRGESLEEDLKLRDLSINAMALGVSPGIESVLRSHPLALTDLNAKVLRPASEFSLSDDPLRAFRAARFASELPDFTPSQSLLAQMRETARAGLLDSLYAERVGRETLKAMASPKPGRYLEMLALTDCLEPWFAELKPAKDIPAGPKPYHDEDVLAHTEQVMDRLSGDALAVWMGLCHDLGKTATKPELWPKQHGHEVLGEPLAWRLGQRLKLPNNYIKAGKLAARLHMQAGRYKELRPGTRVDLLETLHKNGLFKQAFALAGADMKGDNLEAASRDLEKILEIRLAPEDWDKGAASGKKLRLLRCEAIANCR